MLVSNAAGHVTKSVNGRVRMLSRAAQGLVVVTAGTRLSNCSQVAGKSQVTYLKYFLPKEDMRRKNLGFGCLVEARLEVEWRA